MLGVIISIVAMIVLVVADQVSKYLVVNNMKLHDSIEIIPGIFQFTYIHNDGAAFGSLDNARWVFMILSTVAIIAIFVYLFWKKPKNIIQLSALTLIVAGGIGNMIDRVRLGYVIDFIDFCAVPAIWPWIFNVADSCVTIGCVMLAFWMILEIIKESKGKSAAKTVGADEKSVESIEESTQEPISQTEDAGCNSVAEEAQNSGDLPETEERSDGE